MSTRSKSVKARKPYKTARRLLAATADFYKTHGWSQNELARARNGKPTRVDDPKAYNFCVVGAMEQVKEAGGFSCNTLSAAFERFRDYDDTRACASAINDRKGMTKAKIVARLREAAGL